MEYHSVMRCTCIHVTVILLPLYAVMRLLKTFGKHFPSCQRALFSIAVWEHTVMPPRLQTTKFFRKIKSPRTIRKDWVNLRASTGLKELKSDPVVKQNVFVFTLPINPSPSWLSGTCYFFPPNILSFSSHLADSRFLTESSYLLIAWGPSGDKCNPTTLPPVWYPHHTRTHTRLQSFTVVLPRATQGRRGNKGVHHLNSCKIEFRLCRGMFVSD